MNKPLTTRITRALMALLLLGGLWTSAQSTAPDSLQILSTELHLDFTAFASATFETRAELQWEVLESGVQQAVVQLIPNTVDSVTTPAGAHLTYFRVGETVYIDLSPYTAQAGDTLTVNIYYTGVQQIDNSGWGGFYFSGGIAYNLGVGFDADPHPYGRAWHPCSDRFTDRSTYRMFITTTPQHFASAVGVMTDSTHYADRIEYTYELPQSIPSYLAAVAVGPYTVVHDVFSSINGALVPVELVARPSDTTALKGSFTHLFDAFHQFEKSYGPYVWDRVGYVLTGQGAMEHPTLVAYPSFLANGNTAYEDVMAHELAHHWWGDYVTCETAEDMWINEGMAEYSAHLFFEEAYDYATYLSRVKDNHLDVLKTAHLDDNGFRAIYGIPHDYTYGTHVYYKGASVGHNLRGFLGDSLFFSGLQQVLQQHAWSSLSSVAFRDALSTATGVNLHPFFENQVFQPGFSTFTVERMDTQVVAPFNGVQVDVQQRLRGTAILHTEVPITISLLFESGQRIDYETTLSSADTSLLLPTGVLPAPEFATINVDGRLNLATMDASGWIKQTGSWPASRTGFSVTVDAVQDSAWAYLAHHWAAPDPVLPGQIDFRVSTTHYWEFQCTDTTGLEVSASVLYDGRASNSYLDEGLLEASEDSIWLFYRRDASEDWWPYSDVQKILIGSNTNGVGRFEIGSLIPGQYTFGNISPALLSDYCEAPQPSEMVRCYPQPAGDEMQVLTPWMSGTYRLYDTRGSIVLEGRFNAPDFKLNTAGVPNGTYLLEMEGFQGKQAQPSSIQRLSIQIAQ